MYVGIAFVRAKLYGPCALGARLGDVGKAEWACPLDCFGHSDRPVGIERCGGYGWIAQLVEQRTENPCVPGSSPGPATMFFFVLLPFFGLSRPLLFFANRQVACSSSL